MFELPQTNLQLYRQMLETGYDDPALDLANRAYLFAARQTCNVLRGSGKPFACHLVGTAGILVEAGQSADCIGAALLHAMYQDRVPFPGNRNLEQRRDYIRQHFGEGRRNPGPRLPPLRSRAPGPVQRRTT